MCDVLNVENNKDKYYAIDLGIAMQITNICRDVFEDAANKRIYIPKEIMPGDDLHSIDNQKIFKYICRLHDFAEEYYSSALNGISNFKIPWIKLTTTIQSSKTFSFASIFLPNKIKYDVYKVYQFCRLYDDSADKDVSIPDDQYETELNKLGINKKALEQLKIGIDSDRNFNRFIGMDDLIVYSYRVAGCVGIMMCDVLNVENNQDKYYAIDLGIAMQIKHL